MFTLLSFCSKVDRNPPTTTLGGPCNDQGSEIPRKIPGNQGKSLKYVGLEDYVIFKMVSFQGTLYNYVIVFFGGE